MSALTRISSPVAVNFPWGISTVEMLAHTPDVRELCRMLDAASDGFALVHQGSVAWANRALRKMLRTGPGQSVTGQPWLSLFEERGFGLPAPGVERVVECALVRAGTEPAVVAVDRVDGTSGGAATHAYQVRDLGPLRTLEAEVLRLGRRLHDCNREAALLRDRLRDEVIQREEFLTVVSHELRTPVTVITGYNRMLLSEQVGTLGEKQRHFLEENQKSCQRLNVFIGNLVDAAREASAVGPLEVVEAPLDSAIESAVEGVRPLLGDHNLRLTLDLDPACPPVRFDPTRIEQVLNNLLQNAVRFAPRGSEISVAARSIGDGGRAAVEVSVSDLGPGVPPEQRERIFEPYVQCEDGRRAGGLGLGLAICQRIVEAHGGTIFTTDQSGGGARFVFRVPALREVAA